MTSNSYVGDDDDGDDDYDDDYYDDVNDDVDVRHKINVEKDNELENRSLAKYFN